VGQHDMTDLDQALRELGSEDGARICAPGQWVVWRDETGVHVENDQ
jgi:hypothetical protein